MFVEDEILDVVCSQLQLAFTILQCIAENAECYTSEDIINLAKKAIQEINEMDL